MKTFLLIGLDPQTLADAAAKTLVATIADMRRQFAARGDRRDLCVVKPDGSAEAPGTAQLARATYGGALIGGGLREPAAQLELLERIVNAVHHQAPGTAIGFVREPAGCPKAADRVPSPAHERAGLLASAALVAWALTGRRAEPTRRNGPVAEATGLAPTSSFYLYSA